MLYASGTTYFNYFLHRVNEESVRMFFILTRENVYCQTMGAILQEAINTGKKDLAAYHKSIFLIS